MYINLELVPNIKEKHMNKSLLTWETPDIFGKNLLSQLMNWDADMTINYVPQSDVYENESSLFFKMSVPGVNQEDVKVLVENNTLTIKGETKNEIVDETTRIYRRELRYGSFNRSFRLPENTIPEQACAKVENGVVVVEIPKKQKQEEKPKALEIPVNIKSLN